MTGAASQIEVNINYRFLELIYIEFDIYNYRIFNTY